MNKIAVVGSRTYPVTREWWDEVLDDEGREKVKKDGRRLVYSVLKKLTPITVISGGAKGPDTYAREAAELYSHDFVEILPNYRKYGKGAPFVRNKEIVAAANELIAFWDLDSNGTWHTIKQAAKNEKPLLIFGPDGEPFFWATKEDYEGRPGLLEVMIKKNKLRESLERPEYPSDG